MTFGVQAERPEKVVQAAMDAWRRKKAPRAGILFVSGRLVEALPQIAAHLARELPRGSEPTQTPVWLLAAGTGVLTERGELERQSAAAGMVLQGVQALPVLSGPRLEAFPDALGEALAARPAGSALAFVRSDGFEEEMLEGLAGGSKRELGARVFGGGTTPGQDVFIVRPGEVSSSPGGALVLSGLGPARIVSAPACRLLGPLEPVTKTRGAMVLEIADERALDVLRRSAERLQDQPLVLLATAPAPSGEDALDDEPAEARVLLRAIQGVDPSRGGVLVGESLPPGTRVAFAVRDAAAARSRLDEGLRQLARAAAGAAPRFGIYVNCAGRGASLYGAPDVDTKLIRARFRDLPLVGLQTAFELSPFEGRLALQLYTGVLGLFCAPS